MSGPASNFFLDDPVELAILTDHQAERLVHLYLYKAMMISYDYVTFCMMSASYHNKSNPAILLLDPFRKVFAASHTECEGGQGCI
jgi:hypothetical protein